MPEPEVSTRRGGVFAESVTAVRFIWDHPANRGRRARKIAEALAFQVRGRLFGRPSTARIGERSRIIVYPGRGQAGLLYANPVEWPEISCWRRFLRAGDLFVDVGANVGSYTLWALELGCEVIAVEPDDWARACLEANLKLNDRDAEVVAAALADEAGTATFTTSLGVLNHLVAEDANAGASVREVVVRTLDELIGGRVAAGVKIDVEGAELSVLKGAARALGDGRITLMQLEWNPCSETFFAHERSALGDHLRSYGYELFRPDNDGMLQPLIGDWSGPDVFACRPEDDHAIVRLRAVLPTLRS